MKRGTLFVLVGLPGSGKSTLGKMLAEEKKGVMLSSDGLRAELFGDESTQGNPRIVFSELERRTKEQLLKGINVVYDATNVEKKFRKMIPQTYRGIAEGVVAVCVHADIDTCLDRNSNRDRVVPEEVIRRMASKMSWPNTDEGFDQVLHIDNN